MPTRVLFPGAFKLCLVSLSVTLLMTLMLPLNALGQGLELNGGWAHITNDFGTDGFNIGAAWWFTHRVTIAADYESTWDTSTIGSFAFTQIGSIAVKSHLQTAVIGPRIFFSTKWTERHRLNPFGEAQFGGSHLNQQIIRANMPTVSASGSGFTWLLGGGAEYLLTPHWSVRTNLDFMRTHLANEGQSRLRLIVGVAYTFGSRPMPANRPPVASCSANPTHVVDGSGDTVAVHADASDPDKDPLTYAWTATGGTIDGTGPQVRWNPSGSAPGTYSVTAHVDDGRGGNTSCVAEVRLEPRPNRPPTISCTASPTSVQPGGRVHIIAVASDPDNDPLTFTWESDGGRVVGSGTEVDLDTTGVAPTHYTITGHVDDGRGGTATCRAEFTLEPPPAVETKLAIRSIYFPTALPSPRKPDEGLVESQQKTLTSLASDFKEYLANKPDAHLELQGHSDRRGSPEYNQALSERRVELTKRFLVGLGIPEANLQTKALGEEANMTPDQVKQLVEQHPNLTQEQKNKILNNLQVVTLAQNRRVDITLSSTGQQSVRQFPFNAEDALTLIGPGTTKKKH
jgi:outer membrane protein OmpA-like peptidoglycan-associated protein